MQTMKKQSTKTATRMGMRMTTTTVQLLLMTTVAFFDLVHVAFLAPLRVRQKSPVDLALVMILWSGHRGSLQVFNEAV